MASTLDDDDLSLSIPTNSNRRNSHRAVNRSGATTSNNRGYGNGQIPGQSGASRPDQALQRTTQRLGQYTVVKTLGEGSFGKVKLAVQAAEKHGWYFSIPANIARKRSTPKVSGCS